MKHIRNSCVLFETKQALGHLSSRYCLIRLVVKAYLMALGLTFCTLYANEDTHVDPDVEHTQDESHSHADQNPDSSHDIHVDNSIPLEVNTVDDVLEKTTKTHADSTTPLPLLTGGMNPSIRGHHLNASSGDDSDFRVQVDLQGREDSNRVQEEEHSPDPKERLNHVENEETPLHEPNIPHEPEHGELHDSPGDFHAAVVEEDVHDDINPHEHESEDESHDEFHDEVHSVSLQTLVEQVREQTFEMIKTEISGNAEGFQEALIELSTLTQSILDKLSHDSHVTNALEIKNDTRALAIHLDRIDYAHFLEEERKVSRLVGKLISQVRALEKDLADTENEHSHEDHSISGNDSHH